MTIAYWILAGLLALVYLMAGFTKATKSKEALAESGMAWTESFSGTAVKTIGLLEIAGAIGLILPPVTSIVPILAPIAAVCLTFVQIGAIIVHVQRKESQTLGMNSALLIVAAAAAWIGFVVWA